MNNFWIRIISVMIIMFLVSACQSGLISMSSRSLNHLKQGSLVPEQTRKMDYGPDRKDHDVYLKIANQQIEETEQENTTGSLANVNDSRNNLFLTKDPIQQGQFIDLKVVASRNTNAADETTEQATTAQAATDAAASEDPLISDIIKSLPSLVPAETSTTTPISNLKMFVSKKHNNGDLTVIYKRSSIKDQETRDMFIRAKILASSLTASKVLDTNDLVDIQWVENDNGDVVERASSGWEDEYTLRLSGFTEAKSKYAAALEDKRNMLMEIRKNLENQLISIGKERKTFASQRDTLLKAKNSEQKRAEELETKLKEVQSKLDELNEQTPNQNQNLTTTANATTATTTTDNVTLENNDTQNTQPKS